MKVYWTLEARARLLEIQAYIPQYSPEVLERPYRVIYQVKPERIELITVKHYRQRLPRSSKRLAKNQK